MMTRIYLLVPLIFCYLSNSALSEPTRWLMQGDLLIDKEAESRSIKVFTQKWYISGGANREVSYTSLPDRPINCVIAASIHMNGHVSIVEGGLGSNKIRVEYKAENDKRDVFFVLVQTTEMESVNVEGDVAWYARSGIAYEPMKNWTLTEIQDALRNVSSEFPPPS
ncbi:uncharacterized protein LOC114943400 [Nylanderia fulva]|uniref:uncharacterized protein LOC114943400 n=1 Tax=Nylanderia fulva TaxID=613905 RepID=UPI0010FB030B|nr:uncharacterized protein LOC114943400 [Nylanderia fulva]